MTSGPHRVHFVDASDDPDGAETFRRRYADLERWQNMVAAAVDQKTTNLVFVRCADCRRDPVGWVRKTDLGLVLVTTIPVHGIVDDGIVGAAEWRRRTGDRWRRFRGFPLQHPFRYADLHGWRPPDDDDVPHVHCGVHGRVDVSDDDVTDLVRVASTGRRGSVFIRPTPK